MHLIDRLHAIRAERARLAAEARIIRDQIDRGVVSTTGEQYQAYWRRQLVLRELKVDNSV